MGRVLAGDTLDVDDRQRLDRAVHNAERLSGLTFSLYVGEVASAGEDGGEPGHVADAAGAHDPADDGDAAQSPRAYAVRLHRSLDNPDRSVLVLCDPRARALEIVTGRDTVRRLDDRACGLAAASMHSSFVGGDLVGGLAIGLQQLGEAAREPRTLHAWH